jgi:glycosyltransferase involved in cell wall biosynthesis
MILVLHNRYRTTGGEEQAVEDLVWLAREHMDEDVEVLERDSAALGRPRAAVALLRGGLAPDDVAAAVRRTGARLVHAHNLAPAFGWRALAAARGAGARVVLHLHNYRLVCAVATCFTRGEDCTRCHGVDTTPGVALRCRGSASEAVVYGAGVALAQRRLAARADRFVLPSRFAHARLRELGAPLGARVSIVPNVVRELAEGSRAADGRYALLATRLAPEKGAEVAVEACARAGVPLVVCGDGPGAAVVHERATGDARFLGRVSAAELVALRRDAALAVVPSRGAETFGLAAAEAMAAGVPVVASRAGALSELVAEEGLVAPGDAAALAEAVARRYGDEAAGREGLAHVRERCAPQVVAAALREAYEAAGTGS